MDPRKNKIYMATGVVMVLVLGIWIALLPWTLRPREPHLKSPTLDPKLLEARERIKDFRNQLRRVPSFGKGASAIPTPVIQSLEQKLKVTTSSSNY